MKYLKKDKLSFIGLWFGYSLYIQNVENETKLRIITDRLKEAIENGLGLFYKRPSRK